MYDLIIPIGEFSVGTNLNGFEDRDRISLREKYSLTSRQKREPNASLTIHLVEKQKNSLPKELQGFLQAYLEKNMECIFHGSYSKELPAYIEYVSYFLHNPHCSKLLARLKKKDERDFNLLLARNHVFLGNYRRKKVDIFISVDGNNRGKELSCYLGEILPRLLALTGFFLYQKKEVLLLHAAGIRIAKRGFLFPAPSGDGKTTIASLAPQGSVLSDEHMFVQKKENGYHLFGIPSNGFKGNNIDSTSLFKIYDLVKDNKTYVKDISISSFAVEIILAHLPYACYLNKRLFSKKVKMVNDLLNTVPVKGLHFRKNREFMRYLSD